MSKVQHFDNQGHAHFLTFSCYKNMDLLKDDYLCKLFVYSIDNTRRRYGFRLWAFVIMPNHVHLLVYLGQRMSISSLLGSIKQPFSVKAMEYFRIKFPSIFSELQVKKGERIVGRFWQAGGGYDRNIFGDSALTKTINYIHENPVKAGLVKVPHDWKWSSAKFWELNNPEPLRMDIPSY